MRFILTDAHKWKMSGHMLCSDETES